ncbi:hypothetical protein [Thalassoglobus polymorphus]|uniref:Uncharacterized protein n=1 Tax=Thalassoglobus polymorphus TaxID=2527994 RepID=A0A517QRL3_9PLAN|nr:hypothetical protein [Thalassoglobus polymorphus]QDT34266.1 hypothetical protein Mal48_35260 [Thalassoglobus polymorphus]
MSHFIKSLTSFPVGQRSASTACKFQTGFSFLAVIGFLSLSSLAHAQFVDAKPAATDSITPNAKELPTLKFEPSVRVILKSKLGVIVRGQMLSLTSDSALVVPDRSRFRNPGGIDYLFEKLDSLNLPDANLKWTQGEIAEEFMVKVSKSEDVAIANLTQFHLALEEKSPKPPMPETEPEGDEKIMVMQPAKPSNAGEPTVTIICGNCMKKVSLTSKSGQECPHCGILWDNSPVNKSDFMPVEEPGIAMTDSTNINDAVQGNGADVQNLRQPAIGRAPVAQAGQPVAVPPPIQSQAQPVELTMENLPIWMKVSIFFVCFGIMYYAFFHVR